MDLLSWIAFFLSTIGAMNWGLEKFFRFNLVEYISNSIKVDYLKEAIYGIISLSGLYAMIALFI